MTLLKMVIFKKMSVLLAEPLFRRKIVLVISQGRECRCLTKKAIVQPIHLKHLKYLKYLK